MCINLSESVGLLHRLKHFLQGEIMKMLYYTLTQPYISYGIESWHGASQLSTSGVLVLKKTLGPYVI